MINTKNVYCTLNIDKKLYEHWMCDKCNSVVIVSYTKEETGEDFNIFFNKVRNALSILNPSCKDIIPIHLGMSLDTINIMSDTINIMPDNDINIILNNNLS